MIYATVALLPLLGALAAPSALAQTVSRDDGTPAASHPVANQVEMNHWLARVAVTRSFPPNFTEELRGSGGAFVVEMSTASGCLPCADLWPKLQDLGRRYGWRVRAIGADEAMMRSGRLGLPWIGHPVAWVRPAKDMNRLIPIAIGTDHAPNLARNLYLSAKMLTGVRPAVAVRALSKFTGIVGLEQGHVVDINCALAAHSRSLCGLREPVDATGYRFTTSHSIIIHSRETFAQ